MFIQDGICETGPGVLVANGIIAVSVGKEVEILVDVMATDVVEGVEISFCKVGAKLVGEHAPNISTIKVKI